MMSHYLGPLPSLNVQSADPYQSYSIHLYPSQRFPRPNRVSHVTVSSFLYFTLADPRQYALLKMALIHLLPHDESEQFKYHVLLDHFEAWHSLSSCYWLLHIILILTPEYISLTAEVWPARTELNYLLFAAVYGKWGSRCIVNLCFSCAAASRRASLSVCCKLCQIHLCYKTWHSLLFLSLLPKDAVKR